MTMRAIRTCVWGAVMLAWFTLSVGVVRAGDWPQWRGPHFNGSTEETGLPTRFGRTENVAWVANLPGASAATPVVSGDTVFVSSVDVEADTLVAMGLDRRTGAQLWQRTVAKGIRKDTRSSYASSSPVTDGDVVVFFYGNGELAAFDRAGNPRWQRNITTEQGPLCFNWTYASSPLLFDGKLYLQVLQRNRPYDDEQKADSQQAKDQASKSGHHDSYLLALEPSSGKTLWKQVRPCQAMDESHESYSTPIPCQVHGKWQLLIVGGDEFTGHDPTTGAELWRWGNWNRERIPHWRLVPTVVSNSEVALVCAPKKEPIFALKLGLMGQLDDSAIVWDTRKQEMVTSDVPSPALYDGDFFVLSDVRKSLSRVNAKTGEVVWTLRTPGDDKYEASPLVGDGKVYLINFAGDVVVVDAAKGEVLHTVSMDEPSDDNVRSSVIAAHGRLFVRVNRHLYCIGK